ncbi:hypothetical protein HKA99_33385, partial [Vibrio parahaemolyticus]|nr:hypothetical protein [Vibrio parahaemolyticus]
STYKVEVADGSEQTALKDWAVTASVVSDGNASGFRDITPLQSIAANTDIDVTVKMNGKVDGGAESEILIEVVGHVRDDAV